MKLGNIGNLLEEQPVFASAPCRIDFGGTLDISTFHYPLSHLKPTTVNLTLDRRTTVGLKPNTDDRIRIASAGVDDAAFEPGAAPYDHPLGLMFAIVDYFGAKGVRIDIQSTSPPRSGLGGSSVAAVALIAAFSKVLSRMGRGQIPREKAALLAHAIEQGVAGVPCGRQDQLAATFGGVNAWTWTADPQQTPFLRRPLLEGQSLDRLDRRLLVAYLGVIHSSRDINSTWIRQFINGQHRGYWKEIVALTQAFATALGCLDMPAAADAMNRETALRKEMTPEVLDDMGDRLAAAAVRCGCGARFTGAGGGGCMWALGEKDAIAVLKPQWEALLARRPTAGVIACRVDPDGVR